MNHVRISWTWERFELPDRSIGALESWRVGVLMRKIKIKISMNAMVFIIEIYVMIHSKS